MTKELLRELRRYHSLSQAQLGNKIKRGRTYISSLETGQLKINDIITSIYCVYFGISIKRSGLMSQCIKKNKITDVEKSNLEDKELRVVEWCIEMKEFNDNYFNLTET